MPGTGRDNGIESVCPSSGRGIAPGQYYARRRPTDAFGPRSHTQRRIQPALFAIGDETRAPKEKETMKLIIPLAIVAALGMSACEVNTPAGPAGATGATGSKGTDGATGAEGEAGKAGKPASETIVVVPVPAK